MPRNRTQLPLRMRKLALIPTISPRPPFRTSTSTSTDQGFIPITTRALLLPAPAQLGLEKNRLRLILEFACGGGFVSGRTGGRGNWAWGVERLGETAVAGVSWGAGGGGGGGRGTAGVEGEYCRCGPGRRWGETAVSLVE